jgi:hypothetical protein
MKKLLLAIFIVPVLILTACGGGSGTDSAQPENNDSVAVEETTAASVGALQFETYQEKIITPELVGVQKGLPVADATAVVLDDGTVKMYFFAQEKGILSASSSGDFKTWTLGEPVTNSAWGQPRVLKLDDGSLRLYFVTGDGIKSAFSADGVKFSEEDGYRISKKDLGFQPGAMSVVKMGETYFGYFSELEIPGAAISKDGYYLAKSVDGLKWDFVGPVSGPKTTGSLQGNNKHPFALINDLGGVTLYGQGDRTESPSGVTAIVSTDGLNFTKEYLSFSIPANIPGDPEIFQAKDGSFYMIYGLFSKEIGGYLNIAKVTTKIPDVSISSDFQEPGKDPKSQPGQPNQQGNKMPVLNDCPAGTKPTPDKPCRMVNK